MDGVRTKAGDAKIQDQLDKVRGCMGNVILARQMVSKGSRTNQNIIAADLVVLRQICFGWALNTRLSGVFKLLELVK
jgi:hypothetical protein